MQKKIFDFFVVRRSIFVILFVGFCIGYLLISIGLFLVSGAQYYGAEVEARKRHIDANFKHYFFYLATDNLDPLLDSLDEDREIGVFDFYILQKGQEVVKFYKKDNNLAGINHDYRIFDRFLEDDDVALKTLQIKDFRLTLGIVKKTSSFLWYQLTHSKMSILIDFLMISFFMGLVLQKMGLRQLINRIRGLTGLGRVDAAKGTAQTQEEHDLIMATSSLMRESQDLKSENVILLASGSPAIQYEIKHGHKMPYSFSMTLARVDLNDFTQMNHRKNREFVRKLVGEFLLKTREVVERYGGLVHERLGDEIIFIFRDDHFRDAHESQRMAAACIKTIFEEVDLIDKLIANEGQRCRVKASLAHGELEFAQIEGFEQIGDIEREYRLSGVPLIETHRLLSQVSSKVENSFVLLAKEAEFLAGFCEVTKEVSVTFKGYSHSQKICFVHRFLPVDQILIQPGLRSLMRYYRSNQDLVQILSFLKQHLSVKSEELFFDFYRNYQMVKFKLVSKEVIQKYRDLLGAAHAVYATQNGMQKIMGLCLSYCEFLIPVREFDDSLKEMIFSFSLKSEEPRLQSKAISLLSHFQPEFAMDDQSRSSSARVKTETLVALGKRQVTLKVVKGFKKLMASSQEHEWTSGYFGALNLLQYHKERDVVYFSSNPQVRELVKLIEVHRMRLPAKNRERADQIFKNAS